MVIILFNVPPMINGGNTMMGKRPVLVRRWDKTFDFKRDIHRVIPVWIRLLILPMHLWGMNDLSRIGSIFGVPISADGPTASQSRVQYARILVEIEVSKSLPREVLVEDEDGRSLIKLTMLNGCLISFLNVRLIERRTVGR